MRKLPFSLSFIAMATASGVAIAQQQAPLERVQVTGSHINRSEIETASPLTVISKEEILLTGIVNVENLLQELSVSAGPAGNATNAYWTSNGVGTAQVNLRGLGIKRTLVLLNGKRVVNGGTGANSAVDLNMIPVSIIKRIEVLKDGASAIYGADAIAGVVNIITDRDIDGLALSTRLGRSTQGDGDERQLSLTWGVVEDNFSLSANLSYVNTLPVMQSDRYACPQTEEDGKLICIGSSTTIGGRAHFADGSEIQFNQVAGADGDSFGDYDGETHGFNWFEYLNAVNPSERFNFSTTFKYDLSETLSIYSDLLYAKRNGRQIITPRSIRSVDVSGDFVYNPTAQDLTLKRRRMIELGAPYFFQKVETTQAIVGLEGELDNGWTWDVSYNYGRNTATDGWTYDVDQQRIAETLDMSQCSIDSAAIIPCGDYFGAYELSQQVLDYIVYDRQGTGGNQMNSVHASLAGDLYDFSFGSLAFAVGLEQRQEKGWRNPDPIVVQNAGEDIVAGDLEVNEAFIEFEHGLFDRFNLSLAARYSDYSTFGSNNTYKAGVTWTINDRLMWRAVRSTAMRTPSIPELFGGTNQENLITIDPCEGAAGVIAQNCAAAGVPSDFVQDGTTIRTGVGGNPQVEPEKADTLTTGVVYEPSQIDGLSMTWDYFDIAIDNAIGSVDGSNQLRLCYTDPVVYQLYCQGFSRDAATHQVLTLERKPLNAALEKVSGWDFNAVYQGDFWAYNTRVSFDLTRLLKHQNRAFADAETETLVGMITADRGNFANWKANLTGSIGQDNWRYSWTMRYIGKADDENGGGEIGKAVPSIVYNDVRATWEVSNDWSLSLGVDNVFDKKAPYLTSWNDANTDVFSYDLIGRRYFLQANFSW